MENKQDILDILAEDNSLISYRPSLNKITDSVTATILLQQIIFYWKISGKKKFYKFREPCKHKKYRDGDSWTEVLGFSLSEFDGAIKKVGFKKGKTKNRIKKEDAFVVYYRDKEGLTWYELQENRLREAFSQIYLLNEKTEDTKSLETSDYLNTESNSENKESIYHSKTSFAEDVSLFSNSENKNTGKIVNEIIGMFKPLNISFDRFYVQKTQRKAVERMLGRVGKDSLMDSLMFISNVKECLNNDSLVEELCYVPNIKTPIQLEQKYESLIESRKRVIQGLERNSYSSLDEMFEKERSDAL